MAEKHPTERSSLLPTSVGSAMGAPSSSSPAPSQAWKFGIVLVSLSGILHTANNFLIQFFEVDALELLLVRLSFVTSAPLEPLVMSAAKGDLPPSSSS